MDTRERGEEASLEATRESLIAISYTLPDKFLGSLDTDLYFLPSVKTLENTGDRAVVTNDRADDIRSKLISISYLQTPDAGLNIWKGHA